MAFRSTKLTVVAEPISKVEKLFPAFVNVTVSAVTWKLELNVNPNPAWVTLPKRPTALLISRLPPYDIEPKLISNVSAVSSVMIKFASTLPGSSTSKFAVPAPEITAPNPPEVSTPLHTPSVKSKRTTSPVREIVTKFGSIADESKKFWRSN